MVSLVHAARDIGRIREISSVLVRHGFGEIVQRVGFAPRKSKGETSEDEQKGAAAREQTSLAVRARKVLEDLGPSFVKLGQIASTRPDVLPADLIAELAKLQDSVPPVPYADIEQQVERSLGAPLHDLFTEFEKEPLAAASVAQVHRAKLRTDDGLRDVVVKVQRPGIAETVASDVDILHSFAALLERAIPESRIYSPVGLVQQFDRAITSELDFTTEAENAARFSQNFEGYDNVHFPHAYRQASSKHVLTLELLDGPKVSEAVDAGHSGKKLARIGLDVLIKQIFEDGFFHADPHPGNVLVLGDVDNPTYAMLDLGMVGRLSPRMRDLTVDVMVAAVRRDYDAVADALYQIGTPTKKVDKNAYRAEVAVLADRYLGKQLKDIELSAMIRDLVQGATKFGLEIPTDFLMVGKALMTVEGVGRQLDPELDVFDEVKPLFLDIVKKRYSPERLGSELLRRLERLGGATEAMPAQVQEVLEDLRLGRLSVRTHDPSGPTTLDRLGRRIFSGMVVAALLLSGAWLMTADLLIVGGILVGLAVAWAGGHATLDAVRAFRQRR